MAGPRAVFVSVLLFFLDLAEPAHRWLSHARRWLSLAFTVWWDPLGLSAHALPLRPPVKTASAAAKRPAAFGPALEFRVLVGAPGTLSASAATTRASRAINWVYRWRPAPDLADWRESLDGFLGGGPLPVHTLVFRGKDPSPRETIVVSVDEAKNRLHLRYYNSELGNEVLELDVGIICGALAPPRILSAARLAAAGRL